MHVDKSVTQKNTVSRLTNAMEIDTLFYHVMICLADTRLMDIMLKQSVSQCQDESDIPWVVPEDVRHI